MKNEYPPFFGTCNEILLNESTLQHTYSCTCCQLCPPSKYAASFLFSCSLHVINEKTNTRVIYLPYFTIIYICATSGHYIAAFKLMGNSFSCNKFSLHLFHEMSSCNTISTGFKKYDQLIQKQTDIL